MANDFTPLKQSYPVEVGYQLNDGVRTVQRFDAKNKQGGQAFEDALIEFMKTFREGGANRDRKPSDN